MTLPEWYAHLARRQPGLFRLIDDFNRRPAHWVHPERLQALPHGAVTAVLAGSRRGSTHLQRWTAAELGLREVPACWDFLPTVRRVALLGWQTLEKLAAFAGAAVHHGAIASMISRDRVADVKSSLGPEAHAFALRRAKQLGLDDLPLARELDATRAAGPQILASGWKWVAAVLADAPAEVKARLALKLPPHAAWPDSTSLPAAAHEPLWTALRRVTPEVFTPEEEQCFA